MLAKGLGFLLVLICTLPAVTVGAYPLRIWVMHNEVSLHQEPTAERQVREAIRKWRDEEHILIENSVRNLLMPREMDVAQPFADYIVGDNQFLKELTKFKRTEEDDRPIAVEFIRWNDAYNKINSALSSGDLSTAPDIVQVGSTWIAALAVSGMIVDIADHLRPQDFFPPSITSAQLFGRQGLFAAPWFVDTRLLFYRKEFIEEPSMISDWERFLESCADFNRPDSPHLIGFQSTLSWNLLHNISPWLWAGGGGILDPSTFGPINNHRVVLDSPDSLAGLKFLKDLSTLGCADFLAVNQETLEDAFLNGEFATILSGPWFIKRMGAQWQHTVGAALPPAGPFGSFPFVGGSHLAVSASSTKRGNFDRAIALVTYLTSPASQIAYASHTGLLPAHREALADFLSDGQSDVLQTALEQGRSHPNIAEWGSVVENEMIRSHLWHIWRDIAQGVSDETQIHTVNQAAGELRKKLMLSLATRYAPQGGLLLCGMAVLGLGGLAWWKRRYNKALRLLEQKTIELRRLVSGRAMLEGTIALLTRRGEKQSERLAALNRELSSLKDRTAQLHSDLAKAKVRQSNWDKKRIGAFAIRSDGSLSLDSDIVHFENNRQARRLIEQLSRLACRGLTTIHCLWGYALFGWDPRELQSSPQRLFETMVSKINGRLKALGRPPLIAHAGRKTGAWKLLWDADAVSEASCIGAAMRLAREGASSLAAGRRDDARRCALAALERDPKNLEAVALLRECGHGDDDPAVRISETLLRHDLDLLRHGVRVVEEMLTKDRLARNIDAEAAHEEFRMMKFQADYLERRCEGLFGERHDVKRSTEYDAIANQILAVRNEIVSLKSAGISMENLWASMVDSDNFGKLIAVPTIQSMVNNYYNSETHDREDPRLIQLAMVSMLSSSDVLRTLDQARSELELFAAIKKGVRDELIQLEQQLGAMPPT